MATTTDRKRQMRRMSMWGTALFALGLITVLASVVTRVIWVGVAGAMIFLVGAVLLYRVGKALPR